MLDIEILRANRTFRVVFPFIVLLIFLWLSRQNVVSRRAPERVSLVELERATKDLPFLTLFGRDGRSYRFQAPDGRTFLVDGNEVQLVLDSSLVGMPPGAGLFVTIKDGKVAIPDPRLMSEWIERHGFDGPSPDRLITVERPMKRTLPVVRHTEQSEPTVFVLTSDGDWTDEDLGRLDAILSNWLETQHTERESDQPLPEDQRPRLWYDQANSAQDLKTIVVRARNFPDAWCEPLAQRLGTEYPFLWQMDVGGKPGPVFRGARQTSPPKAEANDKSG